jgi:hypothetical protein
LVYPFGKSRTSEYPKYGRSCDFDGIRARGAVAHLGLKSKYEEEGAVEKNQKQQQYHDKNSNLDTTPVFSREQDTEEIVPGVPIIRSNTPRPSSFEAMLSSTGYMQKSLHGGSLEMEKGELPCGFPANAPSAPPLPEELEDDVDIGESQNQILGLAFADAPSRTGAYREDNGNSYTSMYASPLLSSPLPLTNPGQGSHLSQKEQHTESLPAFKDVLLSSTQATQRVTAQVRNQRYLIAFSLYLAGLMLTLLLLAVVQGMGVARGTLAGGFTPLGVPWQVLIYGLLGGCISCIISLSAIRVSDPPLFVMITWFTRPFVGSILAIFSYTLLTSGLFIFGESVDRHPGFFWLAGILAGLCEWWLFCRRRA